MILTTNEKQVLTCLYNASNGRAFEPVSLEKLSAATSLSESSILSINHSLDKKSLLRKMMGAAGLTDDGVYYAEQIAQN